MLKASEAARLILRTCWDWMFTWIYGLRFVKIGAIKNSILKTWVISDFKRVIMHKNYF